MYKKNDGSIIVFSLLILSLMLFLTQQLVKSVYVGSLFVKTIEGREHAQMLALGGVRTAINLLELQFKEDKKDSKSKNDEQDEDDTKKSGSDKSKKDDTPVQKFLRKVLPYLNRWIVLSLDEKEDGVDAEVKICISCENGKININKIYDFKKEEFNKVYESMLKSMEIRGKLNTGELYNGLMQFLKKKKKPLQELSQLYDVKGIDTLDIFYQPPVIPNTKKKEEAKPNVHLALLDIFTIWTDDGMLEPMMLSDALCALMGLRRPAANDVVKHKDKFKQIIDSFSPDWGSDWNQNWKSVQPLYDEKPKVVKDLGTLFSKQFGPTVYSVLSSGKVGNIEQRLLVVVKKVEIAKTQDQSAEKKPGETSGANSSQETKNGGEEKKQTFKVMRAYWI